MAVAMRTNGLHHAISLGNIEGPGKEASGLPYEKCYDSDDDNMSRHRLRISSSSELYPKTSVYSKGDIREQYCLTDRQLNSIERPRRERFFGCLSRRSAPQSFLGVCVGRRAPSDENLAAYAPFYKYPRYQHHHQRNENAQDTDTESSYFRRQPASILSTAKMSDSAVGNRISWTDSHSSENQENSVCANDQRVRCSLYPVENLYQDLYIINPFNREQHLISKTSNCLYGYAAHRVLPRVQQAPGPSTPRTKHVSFARSHTLTSFDDVNLDLRSSGRMKTAQSQERLIGGKKAMITTGSIYEPVHVMTNPSTSQLLPDGTQKSSTQHQNILQHAHLHGHQHGHGHVHQHHHGAPFHVHQIVPVCHQELDSQIFETRHNEIPENFIGMGIGGISIPCPTRSIAPTSPEIVLIEKKFRSAMKTQATQTELRKNSSKHSLEASPQTVHKVKVVSQGAQTNGLINGKKLTKSLSEMPNDSSLKEHDNTRATNGLKTSMGDHEALYRTQSEEPPRSPKQIFKESIEGNQLNLLYYNPPAPPPMVIPSMVRRNSRVPSVESTQSYSIDEKIPPTSSVQSTTTHSDIKCEELNRTCASYDDNCSANYEDSYGMSAFDYESNSLPRRACSYHRLDNDLYSHSLPRRDPIYQLDTCRHITDCTELLGDTNIVDYPRQHLLPPPRQYRKDNDESQSATTSQRLSQSHNVSGENRRMSMVISMQDMDETPFKRDDIRRQSMPVPVRTQKHSDFYVNLSKPEKAKFACESSDEKEIFIDFKPHISKTTLTTKKQHKHRKVQKSVSDGETLTTAQFKRLEDDSVSNASIESSVVADAESECDDEEEEGEEEKEDPLYENIQCYNLMTSESDKRERFRKRSISLEDAETKRENIIVKSAPPSPCQDELLVNASTYPSSDSLANDLTRDHSDGIWNESQVTVLTADTKESNDPDYCPNLLTPSSKRKNLILQHQQRSSIDTDALDLEDQFTDHSPTISIVTSKASSTPTRNAVQPKNREVNTTLSVPMSIAAPIIAVTPTANTTRELEFRKSPGNSRRSSKSLSPVMQEIRKINYSHIQGFHNKNAEVQNPGSFFVNFRSEAGKNNTDLSECSTNTDEYVTCTDTSKRTPGIKTPPTTTSSSSTTQVPVSAQSSQTEKTHGGSSFESASSLYSSRGDVLFDDINQVEGKLTEIKAETGFTSGVVDIGTLEPKLGLSPSHSISSTSSGSYNMTGINITSPSKTSRDAIAQTNTTVLLNISTPTKTVSVSSAEKSMISKKTNSISDDERSDKRYSSSGYYESPHDEEHNVAGKYRRHRLEEDRKRRRTIMKLDIEKENIRALTSPIKKSELQSSLPIQKESSPEKQLIHNNLEVTTSPNKMKRFRPKIRRQFRRSSRDGESTPRRQKNNVALHNLPTPANTEKLLDVCVIQSVVKSAEIDPTYGRVSPPVRVQSLSPTEAPTKPLASSISNTECHQLKAKSVESLRSVSPGSDSVFYSEADGTAGNDHHSHCLHCGKEMEGSLVSAAVAAGDSVESLPGIEQDVEQDIVKPPSDFADSPVATKTTQRLYKKMDKRFRSEERYSTERGRHYKSRQENIRAKSEERGREKSPRSPQILRPSGSSPCVLPDTSNDQRHQIIYRGHYDYGRYSRLTDADVWMQLDHQSFDRQRDRRASTESEKSFHAKYQVILHRLVQRRCTLEMYHRQKNNNFSIDKTVVVKSDSGEFGFRIHGSKPVVVAAIEPDTPAESSGLEVGDIIISVNGVQVLDKHHTEVVKIAHAGCDTLNLEVARTIGVLMNEQQEPPSKPLFSGYLWRQSGQAKGVPNSKKWVRRWFCLRPDHCLYYFKTEEDTQPVGAMIMAKHSVEQCSKDIGKPFAFKIDYGEGIPMFVAADTEELAKQWINILKHSAGQSDPWLENCARSLNMPPSGIVRPDCFGYLMKLGSRWCGWSKRYCVLKDACLYFYQDANSKNSFGMACLQGYKVASMSTNASGRKNSFEIIPTEPKLRHYYFSTESEMDKKRWISALEYSIDRWIKSG